MGPGLSFCPGSMCVEFAHSLCFVVGFPPGSLVSLHSRKKMLRIVVVAKLPVGVNDVYMCPAMSW